MMKILFAVFYRSAFCFALLCGLIPASYGQVKFSATANDRVIGKNDYLQVEFTIENASNVESINPPAFKNFTVVSGPNHQSSMSNYNGNIKQSLSVGFVLKPVITGEFLIGAATAKADGKEFRSNPLAIKVTNASSSHGNTGSNPTPFGGLTLDFPDEPVTHQFDDYILQKNENVAQKIRKNLFIRIEVSKHSCYVGEPLVATYKLYTRLKSESNVTKAPSFNGFSVSEMEMPDNYSLRTEKFQGREYNVYTLRRVQLYPLQSGRLSLEPVEVKNRITFLKAEYAGSSGGDTFFDRLRDFANENAPGDAMEQHIVTVSCDTVNIQVKPLPDAGKPADFKGAVGNYKITASLEKNNFSTDDAGSLKVTIAGAGNIQLVNAPQVNWPAGMEGFESKSTESVDKLSVPMKGDKVFQYPFTVSKEGDYTIPPVSFSYFDINSQTYKTLSTEALALHVTKGSGIQKVNNPSVEARPKDPALLDKVYPWRYYIAGGALLIGGLLIGFSLRRRAKLQPATVVVASPVVEEEFVIPKNPLIEAEEILSAGDTSRFYKILDLSFHKYLAGKLNVPEEELSRKKINERMDKCNVGVGTTLLVNSLLEDIEVNLYAPVTSESAMQEVYEKASEVVSLLDKQIC